MRDEPVPEAAAAAGDVRELLHWSLPEWKLRGGASVSRIPSVVIPFPVDAAVRWPGAPAPAGYVEMASRPDQCEVRTHTTVRTQRHGGIFKATVSASGKY